MLVLGLVPAELGPRFPLTTTDDLRQKIEALIASSGAEVGLAFRTLDGGESLFLQADVSFHAASTMKVPVMMEFFRQVKEGKLRLGDPLEVRNAFTSIVDGSSYQLDPADDSDPGVYTSVGKTLPVGELCEAMITRSSNLATNLLIEKLGVDNIRQTVQRLGADGMQVRRGVEDTKAFQRGINNTTTARALLLLFEALARGEAVGVEESRAMVQILKRQTFNDGIPAGLPHGIAVAHKTGEITRINHDAGIVFAERPYVLVVLVRGIEDQKKSAALIAAISQAVYQASQGGFDRSVR